MPNTPASITTHRRFIEHAERAAVRTLRTDARRYLYPDSPERAIPDGPLANMGAAFDLVADALPAEHRHPITAGTVAARVLSACPRLANTPAGTAGVRAFVSEELLHLAAGAGALRSREARIALELLDNARTPDAALFAAL